MEENFLLLFRFDNPLDSSVEFMKVSRMSREGPAAAAAEISKDKLVCLLLIAIPGFNRFGANTTPTAAATSKRTSSK